MSISIEIFPASYGDCFLVRLQNETSFNILIDGGMIHGNPDKDKLINRLIALKGEGQSIDLLIVTHIDDDHIQGIINLLHKNENDKIIPIKEIWFNGFRHIHHLQEAKTLLTEEHKTRLKNILRGITPKNPLIGLKEISAETAHKALTPLIMDRKIAWNKSFDGKPVIKHNDKQTNSPIKYKLTENITIQILTPTVEILKKLDEYWLRKLNIKNTLYDEIEDDLLIQTVEYMLSQTQQKIEVSGIKTISSSNNTLKEYCNKKETEDTTINNRSSISFILEYEGKRLLFLGDAAPSDVLASLDKERKQYFDVIKVSHHGSKAYTNKALLEIMDADYFIISTNGGKQGKHPSMECLAKIVNRNTDKARTLVFNYTRHQVYKNLQRDDWKRDFNYKIHTIKTNDINTITI